MPQLTLAPLATKPLQFTLIKGNVGVDCALSILAMRTGTIAVACPCPQTVAKLDRDMARHIPGVDRMRCVYTPATT